PVDRALEVVEQLVVVQVVHDLARRVDLPVAQQVLAPQLERVHTEVGGDVVELRLVGERQLRGHRAAERAAGDGVGVGRDRLDGDVRDRVRAVGPGQALPGGDGAGERI